jgi:tetraacyldisaccharide 4'-kinase
MNAIWYRNNPLRFFLYPFSLLYRLIISMRQFCYQTKLFKTHRVNAPVIVVGNITVGGTGKTPLVIALVDVLKKQGFRPGIVLRGYRGKSKTWPQYVTSSSDPVLVGDEAVLLAAKTNVPVMAGPDRVTSAERLIADYYCNVIVSDDGLQHYRLARDIEIAVIDSSRRFGNGLCLPAGPLREPVSRLKTVDFIVSNGLAQAGEFEMQFVMDDIISIVDSRVINVDEINAHKKVLAIAGIGNPDRFFESLRSCNLQFETKIFPDHYQFEKKDFDVLDADVILMTEKDAIKCRDFADSRFYVAKGHAVQDVRLMPLIINKLPH